jgi:hypothetical protein
MKAFLRRGITGGKARREAVSIVESQASGFRLQTSDFRLLTSGF